MGKTMSFSILLSITLLIMSICCLAKNNVTFNCVPSEKQALIRFKASFPDDPSDNWLSSWKANTNCCSWAGVECDNVTGHVVELNLSNRDENGNYLSPDSSRLRSHTIDSSLLELKYLSYLDLGGNDFEGSSIPTFLGSMKKLQYLSLSQANFSGIVPRQLGNLSSLRVLGLGQGDYGYLWVDDVTMLAGNLSFLEILDMSGIYLVGTKDIIKVLNMLPSLVGLSLSNCVLDDTNLLNSLCVNSNLLFTSNVQYLDLSSNSFGEKSSFCFLHNMTSLSYLDLSRNLIHRKIGWISGLLWNKCHLKTLYLNNNQFYGDISEALIKNLSGCWSQNSESINFGGNEFNVHLTEELGELKQLTELDVSKNKLSGHIPSSIGNFKALLSLNLSNNQFLGPFPSSIGNLKALRSLDLSNNQLSCPFPSSIGNLKALISLDLSDNQLSGHFPSSIGNLKALRSLDLSDNQLSGHVPSSIGNLKALRSLYLYDNPLLGGKIPNFLGQLSNLESIGLYNNSFEGTLSEAHFANLSRLEELYIWLKFNVGDNWVPPFQLKYLSIQSKKIEGQFPQWIQTQKSLEYLDLSNCSIRGTVPPSLGSLMRNLNELYLSNNHLEGPIPESLCQLRDLQILDLSRNHLSGHLSDCVWGRMISLVLSSNQLSGPIPNSLGGDLCALKWLRLDNNNFTGQIPLTLMNCVSLNFLDIGDNKLTGKLPQWIGNNLLDLVVLRVRNNKFDGDIPFSYCQLSRLQVMDLALNQLTGNIPRCFGSLLGMIHADQGYYIIGTSLNEVMKGVMLEYTRTLEYLVNLDLSSNHLFGDIPLELTNLIALNGLNLSYNHLGGQIPQRIGDLKSLESLDLSDNNLSVAIPGSLSKLMSLSCLNLSNNNLSGPIPTGPQLQSLNDPSIYEGNPGLCGDPLPKKYIRIINNETPLKTRKAENDDGGTTITDKIYMFPFISSGVATWFWGYFGVLIFKRTWRLALFRSMDLLIWKMLRRY